MARKVNKKNWHKVGQSTLFCLNLEDKREEERRRKEAEKNDKSKKQVD